MTSRFTGDYGLTPDERNDFAVINLISQMGDNPSKPQPAIEAIAVWLANRWAVYNLSDLQFTWNPPVSYESGAAESFNTGYLPGYFTAVSKNQDWVTIPPRFAQFDDGKATYYLGFLQNPQGKPTFGLDYANPRSRGWFKEDFLPIALPALAITSLVFDWSGQAGYAILGLGNAAAATTVSLEIALATGMTQLQVAQLVGSAAIGAVTSGGDVGQAIENAAAAYLGGQAGNFVAGAVDSAAAGKIAEAAVTAGAQGQDVGQAILMAGAPLAAVAAAGAVASTTGATVENYLFPNEKGFINPSELVGFDEFYDFYTPPTDFDLGYDWSIAPGDVVVAPIELGIDVPVKIDESGLVIALDPSALFPDDSGILYNEAGQAAVIPAELYAEGIYATVEPNGVIQVRGPDNLVLYEVSGTPTTEQLTQLTNNAIQNRAGTTATSAPGPATRPAGLTATAEKTTVGSILDFSKVAESLTKSVANIFTIVQQVERGTYGRVQSPYGSFNPSGTVRPQTPGVPVRNVDGSVTVNNGNGTQTTTFPNGQKSTISTSTSTFGTFGGSIGGISTNTLLIAGAGLAALLLLRRK
jgi:hypothetical protein